MKLNVLVFGPHPDDAEIGCGGLLLKMKDLGHSTGIIDMTRGDMGWGTPEERDRECVEAGKILKLDMRANLDLGDNRIEDTFENRCRVAAAPRISTLWPTSPQSLRSPIRTGSSISTTRSSVHGAVSRARAPT